MSHPQPPAGDFPQNPAAGDAAQQPQYAQPQYQQPQQPQYAQPQQPQYQQPDPASYPQPQQAYAQQTYQAVYVAPVPTNTLAIISIIASIVGFFTGFFTFAVPSIVGVIMGHISLSQIKRTGENGRGMAITGLIVGYVVIGAWMLFLLIVMMSIFLSASGY